MDNSPPFQRRDSRQIEFKPRRGGRNLRMIQPSLRDSWLMGDGPGDKSPGYSRLSLLGQARAQTFSLPGEAASKAVWL